MNSNFFGEDASRLTFREGKKPFRSISLSWSSMLVHVDVNSSTERASTGTCKTAAIMMRAIFSIKKETRKDGNSKHHTKIYIFLGIEKKRELVS